MKQCEDNHGEVVHGVAANPDNNLDSKRTNARIKVRETVEYCDQSIRRNIDRRQRALLFLEKADKNPEIWEILADYDFLC